MSENYRSKASNFYVSSFLKKICLDGYSGHVECSFDIFKESFWPTVRKFLASISENSLILSVHQLLFSKMFLWTRRRWFWQHCRKPLSRNQKFVAISLKKSTDISQKYRTQDVILKTLKAVLLAVQKLCCWMSQNVFPKDDPCSEGEEQGDCNVIPLLLGCFQSFLNKFSAKQRKSMAFGNFWF